MKKLIPQNAFGLQSMSIGFLIPEDCSNNMAWTYGHERDKSTID